MNKLNPLLLQILATGAAGAAVFSFANVPFTAALRGDVIVGLGTSAALLGFATFDYSRPRRRLTPPGRLLRPLRPEAPHAADPADPRKHRLAA
jgi:hypothetical protein